MKNLNILLSFRKSLYCRSSGYIQFSTRKSFFATMTNRIETPSISPIVENITKSKEDQRLYRGLELPNKLKVLLISDAVTEKAAAALDVNVGSMCDPNDVPGLAHFLEHMLFLGTKKFPEENEYNKFLSASGGSSNAYTSTDHTQFHFDVLPEHLGGALERFAQFFLSPLFTESATSREVKAVNSEHEKNLAQDDWRMIQLERSLAKENHPYGKFGTGNIQTLEETPKSRGLDTRSQLLSFHENWYSSNIMALVVLGRESLDELESLVLPLFKEVVNKSVEPPQWLDHPVGPDQMQVQLEIVPIQDLRTCNLRFPIPDFSDYYKAAPSHYLSHLVGHEGPGSLLSVLRERGWCNSLVCGERVPAKGFAIFGIGMELTLEGLENIPEIVTFIFQYLNMLRKEGPQKWIFDECRQLNDIFFRFKDKETPHSYVGSLASRLHQYPLDEVLTGPYLMREWRPELIQQILDLLIPSRVSIAVISKKFESVANLEEQWYGTKYKLDPIDESILKKWENCGLSNEIAPPKPNIFIPTNLELLPLEENKGSKQPTVIHTSEISRLWYKQDDVFLLPKAVARFELLSPLAYLDPFNTCLCYMFAAVLKDDLNEYSYDATLAGLFWNITSNKHGLELTFGGYNDKLRVLFDTILSKMTNPNVDVNRFEILKESFIRGLKNFQMQSPYKQTTFLLSSLMSEQSWTKDELLDVADQITPEALTELWPTLLSRVYVEGLVHGNVSRSQALALMHGLEEKLAQGGRMMPLQPQQLLRKRELELEDGAHFVYEVRNKTHKSSCTETYFQCGMQSTKSNMELELLAQIANEPCFNVLRTQEQLGYIVGTGPRRASGVQGLRFVVQSDKHPEYVMFRIEAFLVHLRDLIKNLTAEEFDRNREALAALRLEKPKKLNIQSLQYWSEIISQQYHFDRAEVEVAYLRTITQEQLLEFFDKYIGPMAPHRHRLSVYIISDADGGAGTLENSVDWSELTPEGSISSPPMLKPTLITDVASFKSSQGLYPLAQPYMDIPRHTRSKL